MSRRHKPQVFTATLIGILFYACIHTQLRPACASSAKSRFFRSQRKLAEIHRHLAQVNKPAVISIQVYIYKF